MTAVLPALSVEDGWVTGPTRQADLLMAHFLESDHSQSYLWTGGITSLAKIIEKTNGDIEAFCMECQKSLALYFSRYFEDVVVEVTDISADKESASAYLTLYIHFRDKDGVMHVLDEDLVNRNSTWSRIIKTLQ